MCIVEGIDANTGGVVQVSIWDTFLIKILFWERCIFFVLCLFSFVSYFSFIFYLFLFFLSSFLLFSFFFLLFYYSFSFFLILSFFLSVSLCIFIFQARHSFICNEIIWDKSFAPCVFEDKKDGSAVIDFSVFHELIDVSSNAHYSGSMPSHT